MFRGVSSQFSVTLLRCSFIAALTVGPSSRSFAAESAPAPALRENGEQSREPAGSPSVAALGGVSFGDEVGSGGYRIMFGYGARAGYTFGATPLYLGFTVIQYTDTIEQADPEYDGGGDGTERRIPVSFDIGTELAAGPFRVRPYVGLGTLLAIYDVSPNGNSAIFPQITLGAHVRYPLGPIDFGADARWELGWEKTGALLGSAGAHF